MSFMFNQHADFLVVVPTITIAKTRCENEACDAVHWIVSFTWLIWSVEVSA